MMTSKKLKQLLQGLPPEYDDRPVYIQMENQTDHELDPTLLTDATEFVVDTDDNVIVVRAVIL